MALAPSFVDERGRPFEDHIQDVLRSLLPRLRRSFPTLQDEAVITNVMEEAGQRIADAESRLGAIHELHGYAWVTVRSVAVSTLRRAALAQATLEFGDGERILASAPSQIGSQAEIEREILMREILSTLSREERQMLFWKKMGFSTQEIARRRNMKIGATDMAFTRLRKRIREAIEGRAPLTRPRALLADSGRDD
jgi:DNA-directed RNA polymerase specialized sigma24 family protein